MQTSKTSIKGSFKINEKSISPAAYRSRVAYVMQDDELFPTATPREAFTFSAKLRLGKSYTEEQRNDLVEDMITSLGLSKCADTMIGGGFIRGISGGERKRTSIGVELISCPEMLFLDEPTSGLDSYAAFKVCKILSAFAKHRHCPVLTTIHQPSSEIFELFDKVMVLAAGKIVYYDTIPRIVPTYASLGFHCPSSYNPADFVMLLCQTRDVEQIDTIVNAGANKTLALGDMTESAEDVESGGGVIKFNSTFSTQIRELTIRETQGFVRDKGSLIARFGATIFLNTLFAIIFLKAGDITDPDYTVTTHFGAFMQILISAMFGSAQPALLTFVTQRAVFLREYATGTYGSVAWFFSKMMFEIPLTFATSCVQLLITYFLMDLNGNYLYLTVAAWLVGFASSSAALLLGSLVSTVKVAQELSVLVFVPQLLFSGFFIRISQIPEWLSWVQYLCALKYGVNLGSIVEFGDGMCGTNSSIQDECRTLLIRNEIVESDWWVYALVLCAITFGFRSLSLFALVQKAKTLT